MKIVVRMAAGLANRMFQYSYYLYLKKNGFDAYVDNKYKATKWKTEDIDWNKIFPNAPINQASDNLIHRMSGGYSLIEKVIRHYLKFMSQTHLMSDSCDYIKAENLHCSKYLIGVFQNAEIVQEVKNEVMLLLKFSDFEDKKNINISKEIKMGNSVALHVRKGKDYMTFDQYKNTCTSDYYKKAIAFIQSKVDNPHFYIFTDNPDWVKENLGDIDFTLVDHNPTFGYGNHFDMQLMSMCKHNVIANSTYSWWGAFLNSNKDKIVIGPKYWFNPKHNNSIEISNKTLCKEWIQI